METERLLFIINQLAMQKAQLEVSLLEKEFVIQGLRQEVANLKMDKPSPEEV